ncbi:hypothetical protein A3D66_00020 [Candidatus Kaiserbacteria bacterium RIFCSPHIGHO2_02_FULL_50_9]|uniref:Uncharacterized protein n=1 Tax=Candidatus Kaiserbacteria bacterium RIFCSPLOWO2_01_FULL_51_21 TaxID=1798508 RepID=A0A1F6EEH8_9BACT|nr:MAG: hypothetical protein A3D66_00020 [Candidatus Kaiserbacteria bacterium RIFCSPHIGHO2_02_FULL_50_9]OGG72063.1 MAG: hypothetical protein A3A35_00930 [Candidatus Kaiserbacteria bacterium RIFCSPLOWO2_01_FULL_51_21]
MPGVMGVVSETLKPKQDSLKKLPLHPLLKTAARFHRCQQDVDGMLYRVRIKLLRIRPPHALAEDTEVEALPIRHVQLLSAQSIPRAIFQ